MNVSCGREQLRSKKHGREQRASSVVIMRGEPFPASSDKT